jgi:hypothetical protein
VSLPPTDPFDLVRRPKPPLDGYFWEDIVFVPVQPARSTAQKPNRARLAIVSVQMAITVLMIAAVRISVSSTPEPTDNPMVASAAHDPESTGSISPTLRPTLPDYD